MSMGKIVIKEYYYGDNAKLTILEGGEIMLEVDPIAFVDTVELHDFAEWVNENATLISTKFATGEFK